MEWLRAAQGLRKPRWELITHFKVPLTLHLMCANNLLVPVLLFNKIQSLYVGRAAPEAAKTWM